MHFIYHSIKTFSGISQSIGLTFAAIFCILLIFIAFLIARSLLKIKLYGCSSGFAEKMKEQINDFPDIIKALQNGNVSNENVKTKIKQIIPNKEKHLLFHKLFNRFITRPVPELEHNPSLQSLSDEFAIISNIQRTVSSIKSVSALLPAIGLSGTLIGMFTAFTGTDFNDPDMQKVMSGLMQNFGTALWTTILAVIFKMWADLWCSFGPQRKVSILTNELVQMKYYILDIIEHGQLKNVKHLMIKSGLKMKMKQKKQKQSIPHNIRVLKI